MILLRAYRWAGRLVVRRSRPSGRMEKKYQ